MLLPIDLGLVICAEVEHALAAAMPRHVCVPVHGSWHGEASERVLVESFHQFSIGAWYGRQTAPHATCVCCAAQDQ